MSSQDERELTRILRARAAWIDRAPDYALLLGDDVAVPLAPESHRRGGGRFGVVTRAAVLLMLLVGVSWYAFGPVGRTGSPTAGRCSAERTGRFAAALRSGALPAGARALSVGPDGAVLIGVERNGATSAVELVQASGAVLTLWRAQGVDRWEAVANPSGAVTDSLVAFLLRPVGGAAEPQVLYAFPQSAGTRQLPIAEGYRTAVDPSVAPIALHESVELMEFSVARPGMLRTAAYFVQPSTIGTTYGPLLQRVRALLPVGGNDVVVQQRPDGRSALVFGDPAADPATLGPAALDGSGFVSDGTTMSWISPTGHGRSLVQWRPGDPSPVTRRVPSSVRPLVPAGGTLVTGRSSTDGTDHPGGTEHLADTATGRVVALPAGFSVIAAAASVVVLERGGAQLFRVPISTLADC